VADESKLGDRYRAAPDAVYRSAPAPCPLVPRGEGENCHGEWRRASRGPLTPGPSPANCAGEGSTRPTHPTVIPKAAPPATRGRQDAGRRLRNLPSEPGGRPRRGDPAPTTLPRSCPEVGGGVARRRGEPSERPGGGEGPAGAVRALPAVLPPPRSLWGRAGGGVARHREERAKGRAGERASRGRSEVKTPPAVSRGVVHHPPIRYSPGSDQNLTRTWSAAVRHQPSAV
jgi:hypothetical protein